MLKLELAPQNATSMLKGILRESVAVKMKSKELIVVKKGEKEIRGFLDRIPVGGKVTVEVDSKRYIVEIRREKISDEGRRMLTEGGPVDGE